MNSILLKKDCPKSKVNTVSWKSTPCKSLDKLTMLDVLSRDNMTEAWKRVKRNKGAPGSDNLSINETQRHLKDQWGDIKERLLKGTYKPNPVRTVHIPKVNGKTRMLGIPTVIDRLIQQAISQKLSQIFDHNFSEKSFGFRQKRNAWQAIKEAHKNLSEGYLFAIDIDMEKFFDNVNHDRLMAKIAKRISDKTLLRLIRLYLTSGIIENGVITERNKGTPQGSPLSPLLSNIVLDELDKELEIRGHRFCRYADDIQIHVKSERAGQRVLESIGSFIEKKLRLKINKEKSKVGHITRSSLLGYSFIGWKSPRIRCSNETIAKFKHRIRQLTRGHHRAPIQQRLEEIDLYIRGWIGYFRLVQTKSKMKNLDAWIRSRLRMCLMKQWFFPRTRIRNMIKLGLKVEEAKGYCKHKRWWFYANLHHTRFLMDIEFWRKKGYKGLVYYLERFVYV